MAFMRSFVLLFVLATSALAIPFGDEHSCSASEFYYPPKDCCLPKGGPPEPSKPPHGKSCPPYDYYWHKEKSCCVPKHSPPRHSPPPQCERGYEWDASTLCCKPGKPTHTHHPKPSQTPKGGDDGDSSNDGYKTREKSYGGKNSHKKRRAPALCPDGHDACPVSSLMSGDYECVDTQVELRSCGGCALTGKGQDCTTIEGAWNVGCETGSCTVYTCELGYKVAKDGKSCTKY